MTKPAQLKTTFTKLGSTGAVAKLLELVQTATEPGEGSCTAAVHKPPRGDAREASAAESI